MLGDERQHVRPVESITCPPPTRATRAAGRLLGALPSHAGAAGRVVGVDDERQRPHLGEHRHVRETLAAADLGEEGGAVLREDGALS
jgi:hypothetical protein